MFLQQKNNRLAIVLAVSGGLFYGMNFSVLAEVLPLFRMEAGFSNRTLSLLSACFAAGGILSLVLGGFVVDRIGRKSALWLGSWLFSVATLVIVWSPYTLHFVCCGRLAQGVGGGLIGLVLPIYLMETTVSDERARRIALFQFSMGMGAVLGACGGGLANALFESFTVVRLTFLQMLVPVVVFGAGLLRALDSPVRVASASSWKFHGLGRPFLFVLAVMMLTQAVGPGPIQAYTVDVLNRAGLSVVQANAVDMGMRVTGLTGGFLAILVVKRIGAESLLCRALVGLAFVLFAVALVVWLGQVGIVPQGIPLALMLAIGLVAAMGIFNLGPGACVWTVVAEVLPADVRAKGMSLALLANSAICAVNVAAFLPVMSAVGTAPILGFFGFAALLYAGLVRRCRVSRMV